MNLKLFFIVLLLTACNVFAQKTVDKVVAIVNNEIIVKSELDYQVKLAAAQKRINPNTPGLEKQVLNSMIDQKLAYAQAKLDSIQVSDNEINSRIKSQINYFIQQYGSKEKVEQIYGMSIEKIKRTLRDEVRKQLMVQKLQQKAFGNVEATRLDVVNFYNTFKDSLGIIPEKVQLSHIFRKPQISAVEKKKFRKKAEAILDSIKHGANFAEMAKKYSEDPGSASRGGDLGWASKGDFYPEFEADAFALKPGQVSGVVETPVGFNIIKMIKKRGDKIHVRNILIKIKTGGQADIHTIEFLSAIRDSIVKGFHSFAYYAKKYSEDKASAPFGGDLGTFYMNQLDKSMLNIVSKLKQGEISYPKRLNYKNSYGYHIIYLKKRISQHKVNLKKDYPELKKLASQYKRQKRYEKWIDKLKKKIY